MTRRYIPRALVSGAALVICNAAFVGADAADRQDRVPPAPEASAASPDALGIPAGEYAADKAHAFLKFTYFHQGYSRPILGFNAFDARLTLSPEGLAHSKVFVNINPASVDAGTELFHQHLVSAKWFDTEKYPEIRFVSTSVVPGSERSKWKLNGTLTIKGITKPVTLDVTLNRAGYGWWTNDPMIGFSARTTIKRSEWGMGEYVPQISDEVDVMIELEMLKEAVTK